MNKERRLGDILLDMEALIHEAMNNHGLTWEDMSNLLYNYLRDHYPSFKKASCANSKSTVVFHEQKESKKSKYLKNNRKNQSAGRKTRKGIY